MENFAIVVGLHGDEAFGLDIKEKLEKEIPIFVGNPLALEKKKRFIETDLNRSFPGKRDGTYEERRAVDLVEKLKSFGCILDIHSSVCNFDLFGIVTKPNEEKINLAKRLGLKRLVVMPEFFASGKALIDHVNCGISLEIGPHDKKENIDIIVNAINKMKDNLKVISEDSSLEIFEIFDIIKGKNGQKLFMENFKQVSKGDLIAGGEEKYYAEFDFIPIFVGENAYEGTFCLAAKKIN